MQVSNTTYYKVRKIISIIFILHCGWTSGYKNSSLLYLSSFTPFPFPWDGSNTYMHFFLEYCRTGIPSPNPTGWQEGKVAQFPEVDLPSSKFTNLFELNFYEKKSINRPLGAIHCPFLIVWVILSCNQSECQLFYLQRSKLQYSQLWNYPFELWFQT